MKKILIGICGIGNGHMNRQKLVIDKLLKYDVEIVMAITKDSYAYFNKLYPDIIKITVTVPWVYCDNFGIDFVNTRERYINEGVDQYKSFLDFSIEVQKAFKGNNPDLIITDYEPNVAQFAYAVDRPLICLDQHSKFLILSPDKIDDFSINIERSRLLYFFPKADKRYVSSFYKIEQKNEFNIKILPPIIKTIHREKIKKNKVVVYFSTYSNDSKYYFKVLNLIKNYDDYEFHIYTNMDCRRYSMFNNLKFKEIGFGFDKDLADCNFIISSSGHQLISEAISVGIPLYIFPLDTFDQNYCCYIVDREKWGKKMIRCDKAEFDDFISNIDFFRKNMLTYKKNNWKEPWDKLLFDSLENEFGL